MNLLESKTHPTTYIDTEKIKDPEIRHYFEEDMILNEINNCLVSGEGLECIFEKAKEVGFEDLEYLKHAAKVLAENHALMAKADAPVKAKSLTKVPTAKTKRVSEGYTESIPVRGGKSTST